MSSDIEAEKTENANTSGSSIHNEKILDGKVEQVADSHVELDEAATKRLIRKIDWRLIPFLALLYLLSFLDRTNIGNARLDTLEEDLGMSKTSLQYNHALAIFFPFYVAVEVPSNMAMKRFRPSIWIPLLMVAWGLCTTLMGLVHNYTGLMVARAFLGVAEGGLFPGVTYLISLWYKRHECGLRMSIFFSAATAAGAFGGLLARGIMEMRGVAGLSGWQWIFILEGILTVLVAFSAFKFMHDYPQTASFLTPEEREAVSRRLEKDRSSLADEFDMKYLKAALGDWKIWIHMLITIGVYTPLYSYALFLPTIIADLGYKNTTAQLLSVPPYFVACLVCITAGYYADKWKQRGVVMICCMLIAMAGLVMLIASQASSVKYAGCFLLASGIYPNVPQGVAWNGNNIGGSLKRGVGIAMHVAFGNLGGMVAAYLFQPRDRPAYHPGHGTLLAFQAMSCCLSLGMVLYLKRENARRDREHKPPADYTDAERFAERDRGDLATFFRYTV